MKLSLERLNDILSGERRLTVSEQRKIKKNMRAIIEYITYYELTDQLLDEFKLISPQLYNEIDTIKGVNGTSTAVYIKVIPQNKARVQAAGTTSLAHTQDDHDVYCSEYGKHSVTVTIWGIGRALWVLAHEFGHVKYQVPNLGEYIKFYKNNYNRRDTDPNHVGHVPNDPSGKSAMMFEKRFRLQHATYLRSGHESKSPTLLIMEIKKRISNEYVTVSI